MLANITERQNKAGAIDMPTTELPLNVNTFNTALRSTLDARFVTANVVATTVEDPGSPSQYIVEAVTIFQAETDALEVRVTNLEDTRAPSASPTLTNATLNVNVTANGTITANGTTGTVGQYLASGGSNTPYWATFAGASTPSLDAVVTVSGTTTKAISISSNTLAAGNTTITGYANVSSTLAAGNTTITGFANVSSTLQTGGLATLHTASVGNTQISSLGIGTAASGTSGEIRATNNITAYYSDDRLKTRLGNIENALDKIDQLTGFYYEANELAQSLGYEKVREVAVSAQDTQKVMPEIVATAPIDSRYLTVRYEKFAPLLIEGIKELRSELNNIKKHLGI